jgi:hypothetical protein
MPTRNVLYPIASLPNTSINALEQMAFEIPNTPINEGDYNEEIPKPKNSSILRATRLN